MKTDSRIANSLAALAVGLVLASCGDSDLEQLHAERIQEVQADSAPSPAVGGDRETAAQIIERSSLVFSDEFNGSAIDSSKWNTRYNWGPDSILDQELQYYVDTQTFPDFGYNPFVFNGETLSITADRTPADLSAAASNQAYLSGALTTLGKFEFRYGYAEIRARVPRGAGYWPAFWMLGAQFVDLKPQLFVLESRGNESDTVFHRYNYTDTADVVRTSGYLSSPGNDFSAGFHTYGVSWTSESLTFFVDGSRRHTVSHDSISKQDHYMLLNLAVGGAFPGIPNTETVFPGSFEIDYIRVYQSDQ